MPKLTVYYFAECDHETQATIAYECRWEDSRLVVGKPLRFMVPSAPPVIPLESLKHSLQYMTDAVVSPLHAIFNHDANLEIMTTAYAGSVAGVADPNCYVDAYFKLDFYIRDIYDRSFCICPSADAFVNELRSRIGDD